MCHLPDFTAPMHLKFIKNMADMGLDCVEFYSQHLANFGIGFSCTEKMHHLLFRCRLRGCHLRPRGQIIQIKCRLAPHGGNHYISGAVLIPRRGILEISARNGRSPGHLSATCYSLAPGPKASGQFTARGPKALIQGTQH